MEAPGTYLAGRLPHTFVSFSLHLLNEYSVDANTTECVEIGKCFSNVSPKCTSSHTEDAQGHNIHSEKLSCGKYCFQSQLTPSGRQQRERNEGQDVGNEEMVGTR